MFGTKYFDLAELIPYIELIECIGCRNRLFMHDYIAYI